ncbi:MAG: translation initiation factor IF-3 [Candidatus Marinimicrobia bacterium]|nr:translation initiation factor IF-3 [Candidatus Neomarinimicrobiota bacterium]
MIEKRLRINERITCRSMRLIDENGKQVGIISSTEALKIAEEHGLDLVEIAPQADPPVCKIMDFGKYKYQQQMRDRQSKKKQHVIKLKELRFRPRIGEHDLIMKINRARKFLNDGCKVKITLMFRGRELAHKEDGFNLIERVVEELSDVSVVDKAPVSEGRTIISFLISK